MAEQGNGRGTEARGTSEDAELDRLVARSLAASERGGRPSAPVAPARSIWPWLLLVALAALLIGLIASPWAEQRVRGAMPEALQGEPLPGLSAAEAERMRALNDRLDALEARSTQADAKPDDSAAPAAAATDARIAALEAMLNRLAEADSNAARRIDGIVAGMAASSGESQLLVEQVRELLLLTAVRRMVDSGRMLGPLMGAVERRFALADPEAVAALSAWNSAPVTRQSLAARLELKAAAPLAPSGWWDRMRNRLTGLVEVRESQLPVTEVAAKARAALLTNDLDGAIRTLAPAATTTESRLWLQDARRLAAADMALLRLEQGMTTAIAAAALPVAPAAAPALAAPAGKALPASPNSAAN